MNIETFERMDNIVNQTDVLEYLRAAERVIKQLNGDSDYNLFFDAKDIFEYMNQLLINNL